MDTVDESITYATIVQNTDNQTFRITKSTDDEEEYLPLDLSADDVLLWLRGMIRFISLDFRREMYTIQVNLPTMPRILIRLTDLRRIAAARYLLDAVAFQLAHWPN
jgi:hypothetical protein